MLLLIRLLKQLRATIGARNPNLQAKVTGNTIQYYGNQLRYPVDRDSSMEYNSAIHLSNSWDQVAITHAPRQPFGRHLGVNWMHTTKKADDA